MKEVKKKGVSPVIATVLLIALVIVIALIIFLFMRGIGEEVITKFGDENIKLACQKVDFDASYFNGEIAVSNLGEVPIYDMKLKLVKEGSYETIGLKEVSVENEWPASGLTQGGVASVHLSNIEGIEKIIVNPVLIGKTKKGAKKAYNCEQGLYQSEIII
ncbi:MAG: archaellin/type IV pilin N-terminal domain-containing protein [archaeon]